MGAEGSARRHRGEASGRGRKGAWRTPEIRQKLGQLGFEPIGSSTAEFAKYIDDESAKYGQIIRDAKIKAE